MANQSRIETLCLSQENLLRAGCLDMGMAMEAADRAMLAFRNDEILFPEKIVQIFNQETQERINCLPATLLSEKVRGVKWVSFFPENPERHGVQNLYAVIILSEIEMGPPSPCWKGPCARTCVWGPWETSPPSTSPAWIRGASRSSGRASRPRCTWSGSGLRGRGDRLRHVSARERGGSRNTPVHSGQHDLSARGTGGLDSGVARTSRILRAAPGRRGLGLHAGRSGSR